MYILEGLQCLARELELDSEAFLKNFYSFY